MKEKLIIIRNVVLFIVVVLVLVVLLRIGKESKYGNYVECAMILMGLLSVIRKISGKPSAILMKKYSKAYASIIEGAFTEDKKSYKKLVEAMYYWDKQQYDKVHKLLDKLLEKCTCTKDYLVVYEVKAISYAREGKNDVLLEEVYKKILQSDATNSRIWSNLGWVYVKNGNAQDAYDAFHNAIQYDSLNPLAYSNMATYYMKVANPEKAIEYAQKALELKPDLHQPMSTMAVAYKVLGDAETVEKYVERYGMQGGDVKKLREVLACM